jgi:hypothetical protein
MGHYWERHLELGGSALKSAAWATRLTAAINITRDHGFSDIVNRHLRGRLRINSEDRSRPGTFYSEHGGVALPDGDGAHIGRETCRTGPYFATSHMVGAGSAPRNGAGADRPQ